MKTKKKSFALILALILSLQLMLPANQPLYADTEITVQDQTDGLLQEGAVSTGLSGNGSATAYFSQSGDNDNSGNSDNSGNNDDGDNAGDTQQSAEDVIYEGMLNQEESIDISVYRLSADELKACFTRAINLHPDLYYVSNTYTYSYSSSYATALKPTYKYTSEKIAEMKATYEQEIAAILSQIDSSWSDLEKIIFVNDYIAQNFEYDTVYSIRDTYTFLQEKNGVCQAYSLLFIELMNRLDIPVSIASSETMSHVWNLVQLYGQWYHMDVTWDDPTPDTIGLAYHSNLLLSDTGIANTEHSNWEADYTCTDTTYESAIWSTSRTPFQYVNGAWYSTDYDTSEGACLYKYDLDSQTKACVYKLGYWHPVGSSSFYTMSSAGLDLYDGRLYLNTEDSLVCFDPETNETGTVYTVTEGNPIWGSRVDGDTMYYQQMDSANAAESEIYSCSLTDVPVIMTETPTSTTAPTAAPNTTDTPQQTMYYGDVDLSGDISPSDALVILRHVVNLSPLEDTLTQALADANHDGSITAADALLVLQVVVSLNSAEPYAQ